MARSAKARRDRHARLAAGATAKPDGFQPSLRAAQIRASVSEDISAMRTQIDEHRRHVGDVGIEDPEKTADELGARADWLPELRQGLRDVLEQRRGASQ